MASTANAFASLLGAGEVPQASSKSKKKSQAAKKKAAGEAATQNGGESHAAAAAEQSGATSSAAAETSGPAKAQAGGVVEASEATAILERAAREAKTISDKCRLWKDWLRQAADRSAKGMKYKAADGALLDFKQVLLLSKALEITVERALVSGLGHEHHESLCSLLAGFVTSSADVAQALTSQLVRLAALLADEAPDTLGAAQRAVNSAVAALKAGSTADGGAAGEGDVVAGWVARIDNTDKEIRKQQGLLQKLHSTSGGVVTREQLSCAKSMYKLAEEKLELLQPKNMPTSKAGARSDPSCKALDEFRAVVNSHLQGASALEDSAKGKAASAETQRVQTLAAYRREETIVTQESQEVAAQIRTLEAQLRALRSRQTELEEKRAQLQQRSRMVLDSMGSTRSVGGALSVAHYRDEIAVVAALDELVHPSQSSAPEQIQNVQHAQVNAPIEYLSHGQQYLAMALATLTELPGKLNFCKQRLSHADKLSKLVAGASTSKPREEAEKLLADHMKTAEDVNNACMQAIIDLKQRSQDVARSAPQYAPAVAEHLMAIDALSAQIRDAYDAVQAAYVAPLVEAPLPVSNGNHGGRGYGRGDRANGTGGRGSRPNSAVPHHEAVPAPVVAAPAPIATAPAAVEAAPVAAPRQPIAPPTKQWGRVAAAAPIDADSSLPTPAEAFKAAAVASTSDGFKDAPAKKNRKKEKGEPSA